MDTDRILAAQLEIQRLEGLPASDELWFNQVAAAKVDLGEAYVAAGQNAKAGGAFFSAQMYYEQAGNDYMVKRVEERLQQLRPLSR